MDGAETDVIKRKEGGSIRQRRAKVCFSYEPQHEDELALKVGDEVMVHGEDEEGWYQATVNGKNGVCPSNFVELIPDDLPDLIMAKSETPSNKELKEKLSNSLSKTSAKDAEKDGDKKRQSAFDPLGASGPKTPESAGATETGEKVAKKIQGVGFGNIFAQGGVTLKNTKATGGDEKVIGPTSASRPKTLVDSAEKEKSADEPHEPKKVRGGSTHEKSAAKDHTDSDVHEMCRAEFDYQAANGDELSFKVGDIIRIITKDAEDEGWWKGELNGKTGVFPDNFCVVIPPNEVPAPKRPARPNAADKNKSSTDSKKDEPKDIKTELKPEPKPDTPVPIATSTPIKPATKPLEKPTVAAEKPDKAKPERPEKPASKPVVGKKPGRDSVLVESVDKDKKEGKENEDVKATSNKGKEDEKVNKGESDSARVRSGSGVVLRHAVNGHNNGHAADRGSTLPSHAHGHKSGDSAKNEAEGSGFDAVEQSGEKLVLPSRARGPPRRPPSMIRPPSEEEDKLENGLYSVDEDPKRSDMTGKDKEKEPLAKNDSLGSRKSLPDVAEDKDKEKTSLAKKDSFLKQLDSALSSRPKSPGTPTPPVPPAFPPPGALEDEVKQLRVELKELKEEFASQLKDLKALLKTQTEKTAALEKEVEQLKKSK